jgi:hypothetical protein
MTNTIHLNHHASELLVNNLVSLGMEIDKLESKSKVKIMDIVVNDPVLHKLFSSNLLIEQKHFELIEKSLIEMLMINLCDRDLVLDYANIKNHRKCSIWWNEPTKSFIVDHTRTFLFIDYGKRYAYDNAIEAMNFIVEFLQVDKYSKEQ